MVALYFFETRACACASSIVQMNVTSKKGDFAMDFAVINVITVKDASMQTVKLCYQ